MNPSHQIRRPAFMTGVFLTAFSMLIFQIVQTRILSVTKWYYLAFFAISVAMLGMTVGAVWVYLRRERVEDAALPFTLTRFALATGVAMPASMLVQFCINTTLAPSLGTAIAWALLLAAMAVPYVFSGVVVSLALTRSPFPAAQVYGADLLGAALGCVTVVVVLNYVDGPTTVVLGGAASVLSALAFSRSAAADDRQRLSRQARWRRPVPVLTALLLLTVLDTRYPVLLRPSVVKDKVEEYDSNAFEKWNSYSRIRALRPQTLLPYLWGSSPRLPADTLAPQSALNIDGMAGTMMFHYDGTPASLSFLRYDLVNLAYRLPGIGKSAVIGVGGGRDLLSAHYFGVSDITGIELNPIFIDLHTRQPYYRTFSNLTAIANLKLHVDDARTWFASTPERFDLVQMSMIDTWAATGAGAFSLSENGLYTLEGWRAFIRTLTPSGFFTVSRWYNPGDYNETGRMIGLATAALLDSGAATPAAHLFVASADHIATLVLARRPFTPDQLAILHRTVADLGFNVVLAPDQPPRSALLRAIIASTDIGSIDRATASGYLDLSVPTDDRPFFFNQLRFSHIPDFLHPAVRATLGGGVIAGNLKASAMLVLILVISVIAVLATILVPLRGAIRATARPLVVAGSSYFALIGMGFMLSEIALLQRFSIYLGHPIYSLGVCLFALILSTGLGSLVSGRLALDTRMKLLAWGLLVVAYLLLLGRVMPGVFEATTNQQRELRIAVTLAAIFPLGLLLGFAFPTGMRLVEAVDDRPTPWFWGINGAAGVLASVLGVMCSMTVGISITLLLSAVCYALLIPIGFALLRLAPRSRTSLGGLRVA